MRVGSTFLGFALSVIVLFTIRPARAQVEDDAFCQMLAAVSDQSPQRIGNVESGTTGLSSVRFDRRVTPGATYLFVVALSADATDASVLPASRVGDEAPTRRGGRVAHDFRASSRGAITLSFHAPMGTHYHAALYRLGHGPPSLAMRASATALGAGGLADLSGSHPHPPDCRPEPPSGPGTATGARGATTSRARTTQLMIRGSMPRPEIERVLDRSAAQLGHCAEVNGAADVRLTFVIAPSGTVASASADGGPPELVRCIAAAARRWRFPQTGAGVTMVEVSISFAG